MGKLVASFSEMVTGLRSCYRINVVEFYVVVESIKHWRDYLTHKEFLIFTDHYALKHMEAKEKVSSRHTSYIAYIKQLTFVITHKEEKPQQLSMHSAVGSPPRLFMSRLLDSQPYFN